MITLYTPATGFPDLEVKIAYGLARVGIEAFGVDKVSIQDKGGFYQINIDVKGDEFSKLNSTFSLLTQRLLSSQYIPINTPGISGRSARGITINENESFSLEIYKDIVCLIKNISSENICRHTIQPVGNIIGFTVATSFHHSRDKLDIILQYKNPKDRNSPRLTRRPTNPRNICKVCGLVALLGIWFATFIFSVADREVIVIPLPRKEVYGEQLQRILALHHYVRKSWFNKEIPQKILPLVLLSKIPSSADILRGFDLFIAVLSRQQGYHVDGLYLISIENYLDFIEYTPYNIATIENLLKSDALSALQELDNVIYYKKVSSISKFARLYVYETSTNTISNLLYPETAKYLLREVAMIKHEIVENPAINSLAKTLRYFIREKNYGYVDALRNSRKDSRVFEETLAKMLREAELRRVRQEEERKRGRRIENWIHLPTDRDIREVLRLAEEDFESTKLALVILAFTFPVKEDNK